jgi:Heterokaryon incompatibility protein (HET)
MSSVASDAEFNNFDARVAVAWIERCRKYHPNCAKDQRSILPTRVMDVSPSANVRMVRLLKVNDGDASDCAALSYVWGVRNRCILTSSCLEAYERAIDLASLPKTMKDAICITRQIGLKYLWVDGLCIIQDSESDKATEVSSMRHYYRNALVLIAASKAAAVEDGFLDVRETYLPGMGDFGRDNDSVL